MEHKHYWSFSSEGITVTFGGRMKKKGVETNSMNKTGNNEQGTVREPQGTTVTTGNMWESRRTGK